MRLMGNIATEKPNHADAGRPADAAPPAGKPERRRRRTPATGKLYEAKKGYSNWYFNQQEQDKLMLAVAKARRLLDGHRAPWVIDGKFEMADRNGPTLKVEIGEKKEGRRHREGVDEAEHRDHAGTAQAGESPGSRRTCSGARSAAAG